MRRLYAANRDDRLLDRGTYSARDGEQEEFSLHLRPDGRRIVNVELQPSGALWHLQLSPEGRPERIEARWSEGEARFEAALTCFDDEVLIWRRGAEPISEKLDMPPGYRLLWPPLAGRDACLVGLESELDESGRGAQMFLRLSQRALAKGGLRARPAKLGLRSEGLRADGRGGDPGDPIGSGPIRSAPIAIALESPGLPRMQAELDEHGRLLRWTEDDQVLIERHSEVQLEVHDLQAADPPIENQKESDLRSDPHPRTERR